MGEETGFEGGRRLIVLSLGERGEIAARIARPGFATLLPAFTDDERNAAAVLAAELVDLGCAEFCCLGPDSEELHDSIDVMIEDKERIEVVTTWHKSIDEGCEYFVHVAASQPRQLVALVGDHPLIAQSLKRIVRR